METNFKNAWIECSVCYKAYVPEKRLARMAMYNRRKYCSVGCAKKASERRKNDKVKFFMKANSIKPYNVPFGVGKPFTENLLGAVNDPMNPKTVRQYLNPMQGKFKAGKYRVGNREYHFRSSWEANYALYLQFLKEQGEIRGWEFEADFFDFKEVRHGTTRYLPDFKVTNRDGSVEYIEVKGYMDARSRTKLTRMARYFPHVKLTLVDAGDYRNLKRKVGAMLHFY